MNIKVPCKLKELANHISEPIYLVGGFVRDSILFGAPTSTDVDICGSLLPSQITKQLNGIADVVEVNPRIGTVLIICDNEKYEYTTFRVDSYPIGGYHTPTSVRFVKDIATDAKRRDFTCNAIYCDVSTGEVVDVVGGISDLQNKIIRTVRTPQQTFAEDGLRLLRMIRFACELGFSIDAQTALGAKEMCKQLGDITTERKREELEKILCVKTKNHKNAQPFRGIQLMQDLNFWQYFLTCDSIQRISQKIEQLKELDNCLPAFRLEIFAVILCSDYPLQEVINVFGQNGLKYSNNVVDELYRCVEFYQKKPKNIELMLYISRYIYYIWDFEYISKKFELNINVDETYKDMRQLGLPMDLKSLGVTNKDFETYCILPRDRKDFLSMLQRVCYETKTPLDDKTKHKLAKQYKKDHYGN